MTRPTRPTAQTAQRGHDARHRAVDHFTRRHGRSPAFVVLAPGRVNLIGEHTDYNDGLVLPLALPHATAIAAEPSEREIMDVASEGFGEAVLALETAPPKPGDHGAGETPWTVYLAGMASLLRAEGHPIAGWRGTIATDIPAGAGLSSSAAIEVAAGLALRSAAVGPSSDAPHHDRLAEIAAIGTRVENEVLGLPSGIMDQLISALGAEGSALLIDCATRATTEVPIPAEAVVVVLDTGTRRQLVDSEFAARRDDCERAAALLGVGSLREVDDERDVRSLATLGGADGQRLMRRARHVVGENRRTAAMVEALAAGALTNAGELMAASHRSLAGDYEVSGPALDHMVAVAASGPGCFGARMTGGGFAGCAVALVEGDAVDAFVDHVQQNHVPADESTQPALYPVRPAAGASVQWLRNGDA